MKQYGLVKILKDGDPTKGEQVHEIKLVGNALTFILYKSYFGRDLLNDIIAFAKANTSSNTFENLMTLGVKNADDIDKLSNEQMQSVYKNIDTIQFDTEFVLHFIATLMATAVYPQKPDIAELICSIPPHFIVDQAIVTELLEFLSLFVTAKQRDAAPIRGSL